MTGTHRSGNWASRVKKGYSIAEWVDFILGGVCGV